MELLLGLASEYLEAMLPGFTMALALYLCLRPWRTRRLRVKGLMSSFPRECALAMLWTFSGGMAAMRLVPFYWVGFLGDLLYSFPPGPFFTPGAVNQHPFTDLMLPGYGIYKLFSETVLFIPYGFAAALLWRGYHSRRALLTGLVLSGFIECWQTLVGRVFDVSAILLNTLGGFCGYCLWRELDRLLPKGAGRLHCKESEKNDA